MPFRASGRALTICHTDGFVRIVDDEETGFVLGGKIVGSEASGLITEVTLAIELGATLEDIGSTVHTHPTLAEAVMEAAENEGGTGDSHTQPVSVCRLLVASRVGGQ